MKRNFNYLVTILMVLAFTIVSCQKEDVFEFNEFETQRTGHIECIDFENLSAGNIPDSLFTDMGSGPIMVNGINANYPGSNAAMIFDSSNPTGGDDDLGTPNSSYGGPGMGLGGDSTATYPNSTAKGNILIISEDLDSTDPDDLDGAGEFQFTFGACGPVTIHSITIIDVEGAEKTPYIEYFDAAGVFLAVDSLPTTGDNGVAVVNFTNPTSGVDSVHVHLGGSGGIDDLCIEKDSVPTGCTNTIGYWKTHAGFGPQADVVSQYLPIWLGTNGGTKSIMVNNKWKVRKVLVKKFYGHPSNGITKLYAQLLATKLSIANGADASPVATYISDADAFLANYDWNDWSSLSRSEKNMVNWWKNKFDKYNNGMLGVPHCP